MFEGPQSGKFGVLHNIGAAITHLYNWTINDISHSPETYYASNTKFAPDRNPGVIDWSGTFDIFDGSAIIMPGDFLHSLELFTAPDTGVYGNPGQTYVGQGICMRNEITWSWGKEQSLTQRVTIAANGCVDDRLRTLDDTTIATPAKMCGLQLWWTVEDEPTTPDYALVPNVQRAVLSLTGDNPEFVNSSTGCCTHRRPGNINWELALTMTDNRMKSFSREDQLAFRLYDTPTSYWELAYGQFASKSNIVANRQTGEIEEQTLNFHMKALGGNSYGYIKRPSDPTNLATVWWPPVATTNSVPTAISAAPAAAQSGTTQDISLTWTDDSTGDAATAYLIWASQDGIDFSVVGISAVESFTDVGVPYYKSTLGGAANTVYYRIQGINAQGLGAMSPTSTVVTMTAP